ncbi:MAG TPA: thiamine pyrophosphate-binding protein [Candidatus Hydrogenedentes bacterium]|nr:thiamine pyrophosphate-binding protein [Candidatus Hydrogenedentota bacterium]
MVKMTGGEVVALMLKQEGVEKVFGIVDGTYLGLFAAFRKHGIDLVTPRHEACAVHMAGAYARLTGRLGVAIASNGPGVANALPGVAVENGEGNRVLLITSTRRVGIGYPDRGGAYQYFNQVGVIKPMSKWSGAVPSFSRIPEFMKRAFRKSFQGRPGVVHVDIPENFMNAKNATGAIPAPVSYRRVAPITPDRDEVERAAALLAGAALPIIHAGSGVVHAGAFDELRRVAELLHAPVCTSWGGRGALPEQHELAVSMVYVDLNDRVRNEADVVLALGSRFGETDWWGKAPNWAQPPKQKLIQVDVDEETLGLNKPAEMTVLADAKVFLGELIEALEARRDTMPLEGRRRAVAAYNEAKAKQRAKLDKSLDDLSAPLVTAHVAKACQEFFDDDAVFVVDGGNTTIWGMFYHEARTPNTLLSTPKFGMLGAGVAQALGAAVARPDKQVYCIIGDGAMGFNQQEIETAVRNGLRVVYLVCCDKQWGMVKMTQQFAFRPWKTLIMKSLGPGETINADLHEIAYDKLAESMGAHGERVREPGELRPALERSRASGKPAVIHVDVDPVKHMWAPNLMTFKKMHQEPEGK